MNENLKKYFQKIENQQERKQNEGDDERTPTKQLKRHKTPIPIQIKKDLITKFNYSVF